MWDALDPAVMLSTELAERREAGYDVTDVEEEVRAALEDGSADALEHAHARLERVPLRSDRAWEEPSSFEEIVAASASGASAPPLALNDAAIRDRILAGWLGRCAGCNLGKPVEGWSRVDVRRYLELAGAYPITDYLPVVEGDRDHVALNTCWPETTRGNITSMARDDDIDYTIINLHILEQHGFRFGPDEVAAEWLDHLPFSQVYTAERVAYRNLVVGHRPPRTADHRNPYREWIGAQIRADMWGYVAPGAPERACSLAFQDASLSHTGNGIYGEMWVAALIAAAFVVDNVATALDISLRFVPSRSRLAEAIRAVMQLHGERVEWERARDVIERRFGRYSGVHTINNAAVVVAALLWGAGDFSRTIGLAVEGGWDADCNGATAGSVFGVMHGADALPDRWVQPLNDSIRSAIFGFDGSRISELADRTVRLALGDQARSPLAREDGGS